MANILHDTLVSLDTGVARPQMLYLLRAIFILQICLIGLVGISSELQKAVEGSMLSFEKNPF